MCLFEVFGFHTLNCFAQNSVRVILTDCYRLPLLAKWHKKSGLAISCWRHSHEMEETKAIFASSEGFVSCEVASLQLPTSAGLAALDRSESEMMRNELALI